MDSRKTAKSISYVFIFGLLGTIIGYLTRIFLSHSLTVHDFGLFYSALAVVGIVNFFKDLGTNTALIKFIPEFTIRNETEKIRSAIYSSMLTQFVLVGIATSIFWAFANDISLLIFSNTSAAEILKILILSSLASVIFVVCQASLHGFQRMREYSFVEPLRAFIALVSMIMLAYLGLLGAAMGYLIAAVVTSFVFFAVVAKSFPQILKISLPSQNVYNQLLSFGIVFLAGSLSMYIVQYSDTIILTVTRSVEEVGYYQAALPTIQIIPVFVIAMGAVLYPLISELYARNKKDTLEKVISTFSILSFFVVIPLVILVFSFPEIFIRLLFGENFLPATGALRILSLGAIFYSMFLILQTTLLGIGKPDINTKVLISISTFNIIANILLVPIFGIEGAAVTFALSYLLGLIVSYNYARKFVTFHLHSGKALKIVFSAIVTVLFIYYSKSLTHPYAYVEAAIIILPAFILYLGLIVFTRTVEKKDVEELRNLGIPVPKIFTKILK